MLEKLTAKIYRRDPKKEWGTAWLCSDKYALTAAHCVGDRKTKEKYQGPFTLKFDWGELQAEILHCDFNVDAALLTVTGGDIIPESVQIALRGLPELDPWPSGPGALGWQSFGFAQANTAGLFIAGVINAPRGRIEDDDGIQTAIQLTCDQGGYDYLKGMSGAPVTYDGSVVGLVRYGLPDLKFKVIYAAPIMAIAETFPEVREIIDANLNSRVDTVRPNLLPGSESHGGARGGGAPDKRLAVEGPTPYGRDDEIDGIKEALSQAGARLLTLVGGAGSGKTTLARHVGRELAGRYKNGAYFVDLSLVSDPARVPAEIANALGVKEAEGGSLKESLIVYLKGKSTLLILDGFEELDGAKPHVEELYEKCPGLQFIITHRSRLGWEKERVFEVGPLLTPQSASDATVESLESLPSVQLFLARLREKRPEFEADSECVRVAAEICARLGGLPLAIELAAAQSAMTDYDPAAVLALLGGLDGATTEERQARAVEMSYRELDENAKALLRRLSIFRGGAPRDAAEAVAIGAGGGSPTGVQENLDLLLKKSLLSEEELQGRGVRYRMLRPVREYCAARLKEAGEEPTVLRAHAIFYSQLTKKAERRLNLLTSAERKRWMERLEAEYDEIRAAINWGRERPGESDEDTYNIELVLQIVGNMFWFWNLRDYLTEGRNLAEAVLAQARPRLKAESESLGMALYCVGGLAFLHGDYEKAWAWLNESVEVWGKLGNRRRLGYALIIRGMVALNQDRIEAARADEQACAELFREVDDKWGLALALNDLGNVCVEANELDNARSNFIKSLAVWRELGDRWGEGLTTGNLGNLAFRTGEYITAKQALISASEMHREEGNQWGYAESTKRLGHVALAEGAARRAAALFYDSLALHQKIGRKQLVADCLDGVAQVATMVGQPKRAARLFGAAEAIREGIKARMSQPQTAYREDKINEALTSAAVQGITDEEFEGARLEGRQWGLEDAVATAARYALEWRA
ncbi:MAG TPA: tetratricopeptide repeat protein [Pyrinomonadaceae bacterium]|nr:tetratricopeptide repeat protein [Pyrinomonadaceae bacterium]